MQKSIESLLKEEQPDVNNAEVDLKHIQNLFFGYTKNHEELFEFKADSTCIAAFAQIELDFNTVSAQVNKMKPPAPPPCESDRVECHKRDVHGEA